MDRQFAGALASAVLVWCAAAGPSLAATDFIAPGTPATVGQSGSVLGKEPDHPVPAPRGAMQTLGLPEPAAAPNVMGPRLDRMNVLSRLAQAGYSQIVNLSEDGSGIWRGTASKSGRIVTVTCDGAGHIAEP